MFIFKGDRMLDVFESQEWFSGEPPAWPVGPNWSEILKNCVGPGPVLDFANFLALVQYSIFFGPGPVVDFYNRGLTAFDPWIPALK